MPLNVNGVDITDVIVNGVAMDYVQLNGTTYWENKKTYTYTLPGNTSGVDIDLLSFVPSSVQNNIREVDTLVFQINNPHGGLVISKYFPVCNIRIINNSVWAGRGGSGADSAYNGTIWPGRYPPAPALSALTIYAHWYKTTPRYITIENNGVAGGGGGGGGTSWSSKNYGGSTGWGAGPAISKGGGGGVGIPNGLGGNNFISTGSSRSYLRGGASDFWTNTPGKMGINIKGQAFANGAGGGFSTAGQEAPISLPADTSTMRYYKEPATAGAPLVTNYAPATNILTLTGSGTTYS